MISAAYLGLGSNLGDRAANLLRAMNALCAHAWRLIAVSSIYETEPVDYLDQPNFLNMAVAIEAPGKENTEMKVEMIEPFSLLEICLEIEESLGRKRVTPKGPRAIDIDLLMVDDLLIDGVRNGVALTLPHPRLHLRRFALAPLAEIAPELRHPVLGETISTLLERVDDSAAVNLYRA